MKKTKKSMGKKVVKKVLQMLYLLLKPFIPYIIIFLFIFFFIILIIDAIFIQFSDDKGDLNVSEKEIESYCETVADKNYETYLDGEIVDNGELEDNEKQKSVTWEQIYSLMLFQNITNDKEISNSLAYEIASNFKSKYYYKTSKIITEGKIIDDQGNEHWEIISEETVKLITESITIVGHYKYNYEQEVKETESTRITKEVLKTTVLEDEEFSLLREYLKTYLGVAEEDIDLDMQIVIQAANGLKDGTENLQWLNENNISYANYSNYGTKWPLPGYTYLSSNYGYRTHPITKQRSFHNGIDIPAPQDTPVACPTNGIVVASYWNDYTGNTLVVRDQNFDYIFMHLHTVGVEVNQEVIEGQYLAGVGTTGIYSTGNHLHFSITKGPYTTRNYVNPLEIIAITE